MKHGDEKEPPLQQHLKEQFQRMQPDGHAPESLKKEVFSTLDAIQLMSDVTELFTVKFTQTEASLLDLMNDKPESLDDAEAPDDELDA